MGRIGGLPLRKTNNKTKQSKANTKTSRVVNSLLAKVLTLKWINKLPSLRNNCAYKNVHILIIT